MSSMRERGQYRVWIADDDKQTRVLYSLIISEYLPQIRVQDFSTGDEIWSKFVETMRIGLFLPNVVILDHNMPGLSGMEVARRIVRQPLKGSNRIGIMMVSAGLDEVQVRVFPELKDVSLLTKPFELDDFLNGVRNLLKSNTIS